MMERTIATRYEKSKKMLNMIKNLAKKNIQLIFF